MDALDRRKFIARSSAGAVVAGGLWIAPQMSSLASAGPNCSASGCVATAVNLLNAPFGAGVNIADGTARVVNGTSVTASRTSGSPGAAPGRWQITNAPPVIPGGSTTQETGVIQNFQFGGITAGQIPMCIPGRLTAAEDFIEIRLNFAPGVRKLAFTLTDIDSATDANVNYQERVTIGGPGGVAGGWTNGTGDAVATYPAATIGSLVVINSANVYQSSAPNQNTPNNSGNGNLGVLFDNCGTITSVTIRSGNVLSAAAVNVSTFGRMIGITSLSWCV